MEIQNHVINRKKKKTKDFTRQLSLGKQVIDKLKY